MEALSGFILLVIALVAIAILDRLPIQRPMPERDERDYARRTFVEECALCDRNIYIWQGRFLHVDTDEAESSTPHGSPHRAMPWAVYRELWLELTENEGEFFREEGEPLPVWERDGIIGLIGKCPGCGSAHRIKVDRAKYMTWKAGTPIIDAFPGATPAQVAMVERGWHETCYDEWWGQIRRGEFEEVAS